VTVPEPDQRGDSTHRPFVVRHAYFFGGMGTAMVADLAFSVPWWQAMLIALPTYVAAEVVHSGRTTDAP
jgi:uncharacterized protein (DUF983 family)